MKESKSPYPLAAATLMDASTPPSSSSSLPPPPPSPSSVLSTLSSHSSSSLSKFSSSSISPHHHDGNLCPTKPSFSLLRKRKGSASCKWVTRFFRLHKLSMEVDEGLLLHRHSEGLHGSWGDAHEDKLEEKPKRELRFAAKIAAAMDADGFLGVKDSVCADKPPIGMQQSECVKKLSTLYSGPTPAILPRAPLKQARPRRRRWRFLRRLRRTRVLVACMLQKVKKAFSTSSKRTLQVRDGGVN